MPVAPQESSIWQVLEQPSPLTVLPSSHHSDGPGTCWIIWFCTTPSPQAAFSQAVGPTWQRKPSSILQALLQPSPSLVLPSSQISPGSCMPLPQVGGNSVLQSLSQPSPSVLLLSSHSSNGTSAMPSPQTGLLHLLGMSKQK